jgi:hypothetical protein
MVCHKKIGVSIYRLPHGCLTRVNSEKHFTARRVHVADRQTDMVPRFRSFWRKQTIENGDGVAHG